MNAHPINFTLTKHLNLRSLWSGGQIRPAMTIVTVLGLAATLHGQNFEAGSNGSLGDVIITTNTTLDLPEDGKLHFRSLIVSNDVTVRFNRNARNTPVFILSQGNVVVNGTINVDGGDRSANAGGLGGPGGFDGGKPGFGGEVPPGFGYGPGGGAFGNINNCSIADNPQGGSYGSLGIGASSGIYGNALLVPLVGGSGGGGSQGSTAGGGGGGGAVLIAANTRITMNGAIIARGGFGGVCNNAGSGGAIRLVAFRVEGAGTLNTSPGTTPNRGVSVDGHGRIRVDTVIRSGLNFTTLGAASIGGNLLVFPAPNPTLTVTEAAGNLVPNGSGPVVFTLPFGSSTNRTIKIQARDFARAVPIRVTLTPDSGAIRVFDAEVNNSTVNPAVVDVPVTVPINTLVTVHCWTR